MEGRARVPILITGILSLVALQYPGRAVTLGRRREQHPVVVALRHVDVVLIGSAVVLSVIGSVMVYTATRLQLLANGVDPQYYLKRQLIWLLAGLVVMVVCIVVDYQKLERFGYVIYGLVVVSLVAVLSHSLGVSQQGSQRWFAFGPLQIQPSEFGALALVIAVATYCSRHEMLKPRHLVAISALAGIPMLLVYKQPDLGTAIIMGVVLVAMLVTAGVRLRYLLAMTFLGAGAIFGAVHFGLLHQYQLSRLTSFLHPGTSIQGSNYNLNMAKTAIASGGLTGSGIGHGAATNGGYVPEQYTDFIFTAVGEQLGFAGAVVVIGLFGTIVFRMLRAAQIARDSFGRLLCAGALAFVAFSVFQNIGMDVGLMPIAGIPLPFLSYGGTALMVFFATVGLVVNVEMRRSMRR